MACFHAAQALIVAKTGHVPKTHRGVQSEFTRLTHGVATVDRELCNFLSDSYEFKSHADYFSGPVDAISDDDAIEAIETARRFVAHFAALIDTDNPT